MIPTACAAIFQHACGSLADHESERALRENGKETKTRTTKRTNLTQTQHLVTSHPYRSRLRPGQRFFSLEDQIS